MGRKLHCESSPRATSTTFAFVSTYPVGTREFDAANPPPLPVRWAQVVPNQQRSAPPSRLPDLSPPAKSPPLWPSVVAAASASSSSSRRKPWRGVRVVVLLLHALFIGAVFLLDPTLQRRIHEAKCYFFSRAGQFQKWKLKLCHESQQNRATISTIHYTFLTTADDGSISTWNIQQDQCMHIFVS
ncbi:hypothetical protein E2562_009413 [Oryza meyeriana var. granulata]|uniref:Uncharacterized protein n=1 Tax=Oryza meyeriana var. granulata TaxID=110450 RepID=A0A6G1BSB0_9ORYZ|nr:hypothetical protein E2562_009413 [Oryza meyeriana var. granulata]